jgi:polysaccharide biosynthesis/export protein
MTRFLKRMAWVVALPIMLAFSALQASAQEGGYLIRPGDVLRIEVLEDPGLNRSVLVAPDGRAPPASRSKPCRPNWRNGWR